MRYKSIPANPMEIAKIRMLFNVPTSAKMILDSGCTDALCYIIPEGIFCIQKLNNTGNFNKDYRITKQITPKGTPKNKCPIFLDEIDACPSKFLGKPLNEEKK